MLKRTKMAILALCAFSTMNITAQAEPENGHIQKLETHNKHMVVLDKRILVHFPERLRIDTLAHMRDHLITIGRIQAALADNEFDKASEIAEQRLGLSSLKLNGAHEVSKYMPSKMRLLGMSMHRSASHFALVASNAAVSRNMKPVLAALSQVTASCAACHSTFRLH